VRDYRAEHYPSEEMEVCQKNIDMFFKFMHKRHMIWYRRFVKKLPRKKWTKDKILKKHKYTNIYRELDRGTLWYLKYIAEPWKEKFDKLNNKKEKRLAIRELIWKTGLYRLCNRVETFEEVGIPSYKKYDSVKYTKKLNKILKRGDSVMTSAHLTCPTSKGKTKVQGYVDALDSLHSKVNDFSKRIKKCKTMKEIFTMFRESFCIGPFTAYEMLCDLMYVKAIPFTEDDWANVGPGAKEGIKLLYPSSKGKQIYERMVQLRDEQHEHLERLGINFKFYEKFTKGHLSLRSIEHSLCEFSKYWLQRKELGKVRMIFEPDTHKSIVSSEGDEILNKR